MKSPWSERETERRRRTEGKRRNKSRESLVKEIKMLSQVIIEADDDTNCSYYRIENEWERQREVNKSKRYVCATMWGCTEAKVVGEMSWSLVGRKNVKFRRLESETIFHVESER